MKTDIYADFWKEQFVHLLHKNMVKTETETLVFENAQKAFDRFSFAHPEVKVQIEFSQSYVTWECFITPVIKLRLYIQNQVKASLLQKSGSEFVKLADAKFPYNPFAEIAELLKNKDSLVVELEQLEEAAAKKQRQLALLREFVKAKLNGKYEGQDGVYFNIEESDSELIVTVVYGERRKEVRINPENYLKVVENL